MLNTIEVGLQGMAIAAAIGGLVLMIRVRGAMIRYWIVSAEGNLWRRRRLDETRTDVQGLADAQAYRIVQRLENRALISGSDFDQVYEAVQMVMDDLSGQFMGIMDQYDQDVQDHYWRMNKDQGDTDG